MDNSEKRQAIYNKLKNELDDSDHQEIINRLKNIEDKLEQNADIMIKLKELKDLFTIISQVDDFNIKKEFDQFFKTRENAKKMLSFTLLFFYFLLE